MVRVPFHIHHRYQLIRKKRTPPTVIPQMVPPIANFPTVTPSISSRVQGEISIDQGAAAEMLLSVASTAPADLAPQTSTDLTSTTTLDELGAPLIEPAPAIALDDGDMAKLAAIRAALVGKTAAKQQEILRLAALP